MVERFQWIAFPLRVYNGTENMIYLFFFQFILNHFNYFSFALRQRRAWIVAVVVVMWSAFRLYQWADYDVEDVIDVVEVIVVGNGVFDRVRQVFDAKHCFRS